MFFWFNAGAVTAIVISNILSDSFGGHWVILPIMWLTGFVTHAITFHLYWTIRRDTYSPGLGPRLLDPADFTIGTIAGIATIVAFLTVGPTVLFPRLTEHRRVTHI